MNARALIVDSEAIQYMEAYIEPPSEWFENFRLQDSRGKVFCYEKEGVVCLLGANVNSDSRLAIISLGTGNFFLQMSPESRMECFRRIRRAALAIFTSNVSVPISWRPFKSGRFLSFQACRKGAQEQGRIEVDCHPFGTKDAYFFNYTLVRNELVDSKPDREIFSHAKSVFARVLDEGEFKVPEKSTSDLRNIVLDEQPPFFEYAPIPISDWYKSRLAQNQLAFVDAPEDRPLRLKGAPGTGKTVALTVKFLKSIYQRADAGKKFSLVFLTHNAGSVEATSALLHSMDERHILFDLPSGCSAKILTLVELAYDALKENLSGLQPISLDALEGRQLQMELIESVLSEYSNSDWILKRPSCSEIFRAGVEAKHGSRESRRFIWELMNEFACVLDAGGVRSSAAKRKKYLNEPRTSWMMPLATQSERQVVLGLYDLFRKNLREMGAISVDQLISDFLGYLDSNRWDVIRENIGFDAVFVDEMHLFNREERMVFHALMRKPDSPPAVFMAYDPKQSQFDTLLNIEDGEDEKDGEENTIWSKLGIGKIQKIELSEVFRYTPQIALLLSRLDEKFPAIDLGDEWAPYLTTTQTENGETPVLVVMPDIRQTYERVFIRASNYKKAIGSSKNVAVLVCNEDDFSSYIEAGQHRDLFIGICSREEAADVRMTPKKFVLSMPQFVAGLQFDVVLLLGLNESEAPSGPFGYSLKRKFLSQIYLGASRAKQVLELYSSSDGGGPTSLLDTAISTGAVNRCDFNELPRI